MKVKTTITTAGISLSMETAINCLKSDNPLEAYRIYLLLTNGIDPTSVTNYDLENLKKALAVALGQIELAKLMGLPVVEEKP